ncbi:hypothetical protein ACVW00_001468 [Marmoricola sp. URHA0025 HA25]
MTITSAPAATTRATEGQLPGRRVLVGFAVVYLLVFVAIIALGDQRESDADPAKIIADYDRSDVLMQVMTYTVIVGAAVLAFLGSALRSVLVTRTRRWTADVALIGFVVMGLALAGFAMTALALHAAIDSGDTTVVHALNIVDTTNFPIAMLAMILAMIGVGITALREQALPTWLCWASIVLGVMAPLGPLGFAPFMLFPVWTVVVAAMIRLPEAS